MKRSARAVTVIISILIVLSMLLSPVIMAFAASGDTSAGETPPAFAASGDTSEGETPPVSAAAADEGAGKAPASASAATTAAASETLAQPAVPDPAETASGALHEFVEGKRKAVYCAENDHISYFIEKDTFADGGSYTIDEIIEGFRGAAEKVNDQNPGLDPPAGLAFEAYAFLNEETDPLLALHIKGNDFGYEEFQAYLFFYYDSALDEIRLAYCNDAWSRSRMHVNAAGIVAQYSAGSAFLYAFDYLRIRGDGKADRLYSAAFDSWKTSANSDLDEWEKNDCLASYTIGDGIDVQPEEADQADKKETAAQDVSAEDAGAGATEAPLETVLAGEGDGTSLASAGETGRAAESADDGWQPVSGDYYTLFTNTGYDQTFLLSGEEKLNTDSRTYALFTESGLSLAEHRVITRAILDRFESIGLPLEALYAPDPEWIVYVGNE